MSREFSDEQRKGMLGAIHEREGRWDRVDPDTEVAGIGDDLSIAAQVRSKKTA